MDLQGQRQLDAARQVVWDALNDPASLRECLRGCERLDRVSDSGFEATIAARVGPIKATFIGAMTLSDVEPPNAYTMVFEGKGGAAGFAKGRARVRLADEAGGTLVHYTVEMSLGGKLGQMGTRVIGGVAREMADDFFGRFAELIGRRAPAATAPPAPAAIPPQPGAVRWRWAIVVAIAAALAVAALLLLR